MYVKYTEQNKDTNLFMESIQSWNWRTVDDQRYMFLTARSNYIIEGLWLTEFSVRIPVLYNFDI